MKHAGIIVLIVAFLIISLTQFSDSAERNGSSEATVGTLTYVDSLAKEDWEGVCSVALSSDGRHAYSEAFDTAAVFACQRDASTG